MDLSIIIAHFNPGNHPNCLASFKRTLETISNQNKSYNIEVIIADDGSPNNKSIQTMQTQTILQNGRNIHVLKNSSLKKFLKSCAMEKFQITKWLYLPKEIECMSKARLLNVATSIASSKNLFFLDDDNYFISKNSISKIMHFFKDYQLIIGQIQDSNGHLRPYSSNRVQGTTFGIKKEILINAGLFGEWTELTSSGVDSDLWWKLYYYFQKNITLKACYTSDIQTIDSCSKRWRPFIKSFFRKRKLIRAFDKEHQCTNYTKVKFNPSRNKKNWIINLS